MVRKSACFLLLLLFIVPVRAASTPAELYARDDFAAAAKAGAALIREQGPTADRLYNLGNAHFKLKQYGPAIHAYESAALMAPLDSDIQANLKLALQKARTLPRPPSHWWEWAPRKISLSAWSWITLGGALTAGILIFLRGLISLRGPGAMTATVSSILLTVIGVLALREGLKAGRVRILTAATPVLKVSPFADAGEAASPPPGTTVIASEQSGGWSFVTVAGGSQRGWVADADAPAVLGKPVPAWLSW